MASHSMVPPRLIMRFRKREQTRLACSAELRSTGAWFYDFVRVLLFSDCDAVDPMDILPE